MKTLAPARRQDLRSAVHDRGEEERAADGGAIPARLDEEVRRRNDDRSRLERWLVTVPTWQRQAAYLALVRAGGAKAAQARARSAWGQAPIAPPPTRDVRIFRDATTADGADPDDPAVQAALTTGGTPLADELLRELAELLPGVDLRRVRLHSDGVSHAAARALQARAFTVGEDVYFAAGALDGTAACRALLLHELTHVRQFQEGRAAATSASRVSAPDEPLEREARAVATSGRDASSAVTRSTTATATPSSAPPILRDPIADPLVHKICEPAATSQWIDLMTAKAGDAATSIGTIGPHVQVYVEKAEGVSYFVTLKQDTVDTRNPLRKLNKTTQAWVQQKSWLQISGDGTTVIESTAPLLVEGGFARVTTKPCGLPRSPTDDNTALEVGDPWLEDNTLVFLQKAIGSVAFMVVVRGGKWDGRTGSLPATSLAPTKAPARPAEDEVVRFVRSHNVRGLAATIVYDKLDGLSIGRLLEVLEKLPAPRLTELLEFAPDNRTRTHAALLVVRGYQLSNALVDDDRDQLRYDLHELRRTDEKESDKAALLAYLRAHDPNDPLAAELEKETAQYNPRIDLTDLCKRYRELEISGFLDGDPRGDSPEEEKTRTALEDSAKEAGFGSIDGFRGALDQLQESFESSTVARGKDQLDLYGQFLDAQDTRYQDPANVTALFKAIKKWKSAVQDASTPREPTAEGDQQAEAAKASAQAAWDEAAAAHPLLRAQDCPQSNLYTDKTEEQVKRTMRQHIDTRRGDIATARAAFDERDTIYKLPKLLEDSKRRQRAPGPMVDVIISRGVDRLSDRDDLKAVIGITIAVALTIATVLAGAEASLVIGLASTAVSVPQAIVAAHEYSEQNAQFHTGLTDNAPSQLNLALAVAAVVLDVGMLTGELALVIADLKRARDVTRFSKQVAGLEQLNEATKVRVHAVVEGHADAELRALLADHTPAEIENMSQTSLKAALEKRGFGAIGFDQPLPTGVPGPGSTGTIDPARLLPTEALAGKIGAEAKVKDLEAAFKKLFGGFKSSHPIEVVVDLDGKTFYVVNGHHRLEAARRAGLSKVPYKVVDARSYQWKTWQELRDAAASGGEVPAAARHITPPSEVAEIDAALKQGDATVGGTTAIADPKAPVAVADFIGPGDATSAVVARIQPEPGYFDLVIHGDGDDFLVWHKGAWEKVDHRRLATFLDSGYGYQKGTPVRLLSCEGGVGGRARDFSNKIGVDVKATSERIWIQADGSVTTGSTAAEHTGAWDVYSPGNKKVSGGSGGTEVVGGGSGAVELGAIRYEKLSQRVRDAFSATEVDAIVAETRSLGWRNKQTMEFLERVSDVDSRVLGRIFASCDPIVERHLTAASVQAMRQEYGFSLAVAFHDRGTIASYEALYASVEGWGGRFQAHHIVEQKVLAHFGHDTQIAPAVVLAKTEHEALSATLAKLLPPHELDEMTKKEIYEAYAKAYADHPLWLSEVRGYFFE